jgi:hypothetical protein
MNLYGFAGGDPVNYSDPFGLCPPKDENTSDCEAGTSGWYANRLATGQGNSVLNTIGGLLTSCNESAACSAVLDVASVGADVLERRGGSALIEQAYKRPGGATTAAQRAAVQGGACVKCGAAAERMVAGHRKALVEEYYETGTINKARMRSLEAVQSECPTCSAREGGLMSQFSRQMKRLLGLP